MPAASNVIDALLRLGEQIAEAVEAEDWSRLSTLVDRRTKVARQLRNEGRPVESDLSRAERKKKVEILSDQNQYLTGLLHEQLDEIEEELTQIGQLKHAQDSYETSLTRKGVLPSKLKG